MIESLMGSKVRVKILRLMAQTDRDYTLQEVVQKIGLSTGCALPAIKGLEEKRIVLTTKIGRSTLYRLNRNHLLYTQLKDLFDKERSGYKDIAKEYADAIDKKDIVNVILFGSVARGDTLEPGDIDILEIKKGKVDEMSDQNALARIAEKYDVHVSPIQISKADALKKLRSFDNFIITVVDEGIILYGDDRWLRK